MSERTDEEATTISLPTTQVRHKAWHKPTVTRLPMDKTAGNILIPGSDGSGTSTGS